MTGNVCHFEFLRFYWSSFKPTATEITENFVAFLINVIFEIRIREKRNGYGLLLGKLEG
jgi:hypothetical protein